MADSSHNSSREIDENEMVIEIPESNVDSIINEWKGCFSCGQSSKSDTRRKRRIQKVPAMLREVTHNKQEYEPVVVSFGPYHHRNDKFQAAETLKIISLEMYVSKCGGKTKKDLLDKVLEVVGDAKSCYVMGSTDEYTNEDFAKMMLLDGCLILNLIVWAARGSSKVFIPVEHMGVLGASNLYRDMFLLENQIPYRVLQVLMSIRFDGEQNREKILNKFFNLIMFGQRVESKNLEVTIGTDDTQPPLHLLEIYRTYFVYKPTLTDVMKHNSYSSATELKAKGIRFRPSNNKSMTGIKFKSHYLYGYLEIPPTFIVKNTKSRFLNLIAYEMCPNNPNDFRVISYVGFMKSLIDHPADVKELQTNKILLNCFGKDKEVVNMFEEINVLLPNFLVLKDVEERKQKRYRSRTKTWIAELISQHFSSPWTTIALLGAIFILVLTFIQTLFTVRPKSK